MRRIPLVVLLVTGVAIGAAGLLFVAAATKGSTAAISPAAEANQGLLSLLALVAALWIALFEHLRANAAEARRRREFIDMICGFIAEADALAASEVPSDPAPQAEWWERWNDRVQQIESMIDLTRGAAAPDAKLALLVAEVLHEFVRARVQSASQLHHKPGAAAMKLRALREELKARRGR